ncbi:nuclear transport factor 2 family protein [Xanthomonas medicagonis]|uniref:nuclear transport factor 2 family protein n=1 Tax=Xanthomonas medicagonis TaxID=3160841 RepID=UPI0035176AE9
MSDLHKETLNKANAAISRADFDGFLRHCTEDTVWNFIGERTLRGKDAVRQWMTEAYKAPPVFQVHRMIAEGPFVAAIGEITLKDANGQATTHAYCDVWRFEDGLMAELNAYVVAS